MTQPLYRQGRQVDPKLPATVHAPNAALLIDFDNVTLGIRSDLAKELRTLLNSDIIKGKVAVQRAYADWRRYPQYIVPLSESSVDLIFAPAFGTAKKNATDIRLAIDAIELIFTRPEIGTFILLSGDSDFSSLVIKLKEYGKYVIGVGIRESASDLLIQNCDEYYSYSDLAGLTKETELSSIQRDPWELVGEAVAQMARNGDVMRSDRLKQVMQQLDPNFDERNAGFSRFSKFVVEAGNKGLLKVTKLDNGQFEVAPLAGAPAARLGPAPEPRAEAPREEGGRRGRSRRGRGRDRDREAAPEAAARPAASEDAPLSLARAFQLLTRALGELGSNVPHETLRLRMVALHGKEDPLLEPVRFVKLLRQANDAEVADVRKLGDDAYEVSPHKADIAFQRRAPSPAAPAAPAAGSAVPAVSGVEAVVTPPGPNGARGGVRFRRGSRMPARPPEIPLIGVVEIDEPAPAQVPEPAPAAGTTAEGEATNKTRRGGRGRGGAKKAAARKQAAAPAPEPPAETKAAARPARKRSRSPAKKKAE